jgi:hypothetical protein
MVESKLDEGMSLEKLFHVTALPSEGIRPESQSRIAFARVCLHVSDTCDGVKPAISKTLNRVKFPEHNICPYHDTVFKANKKILCRIFPRGLGIVF